MEDGERRWDGGVKGRLLSIDINMRSVSTTVCVYASVVEARGRSICCADVMGVIHRGIDVLSQPIRVAK